VLRGSRFTTQRTTLDSARAFLEAFAGEPEQHLLPLGP